MRIRYWIRFNSLLMLALDTIFVAVCYYAAYLLRFEFSIPERFLYSFFHTLPLVIAIKIPLFAYFKLYRGMWRYTSVLDLINVLKAVFTSTLLIILAVLVLYRFKGYPRSVFFVDGIMTLVAVGGIRFAIRVYLTSGWGGLRLPALRTREGKEKRLLVIGAGGAGEKVVREIFENPGVRLRLVGFLDDNPHKIGKTIHGIPVLGPVDDLAQLPIAFDEIVIAIPSARGAQMRRIVDMCERSGKRYRTLPSVGELINGTVSIKASREVTIQDLLGREEVRIDEAEIAQYLKEKEVMVTGAGGSIGSELVRQICRFGPKSVGLIEISEYNLFRVEMECRQRFPKVDARSFLADIRDRDSLRRIFEEFKPKVVFHAAAYKHVPIQEVYPWEAVHNNVGGTRNVCYISTEVGVERFVLVSSDKAVRPTNVMGATKRVAELLIECFNEESGTKFVAVRFGNVIGSSGSAIPIFQEQIARGGPVTVTHPEVTRFFMSTAEAAQLILQAGAIGKGGEIFVLDMGKPVPIVDIASDLIRLQGFEPERDIPIKFIGLRPGEKLHEDLITDGEAIAPTVHKKILSLVGNNHFDSISLHLKIDELLLIAANYDAPGIKKTLKNLIPEYTPYE
jgi:FlaA1/EpsC-like NDP-sugar epimerase